MTTNHENGANNRAHLTRYAWLSIAAACLTIGMKTAAYYLTGSVGLLSDALELLVNLAGALMALAMLIIAARPADEEHAYGHSKAEYFSSGFEGALILVAAVMITVTAVRRLITPEPLEQVGLGLVISIAASLINLGVALVMLPAAKRYQLHHPGGGRPALIDRCVDLCRGHRRRSPGCHHRLAAPGPTCGAARGCQYRLDRRGHPPQIGTRADGHRYPG